MSMPGETVPLPTEDEIFAVIKSTCKLPPMFQSCSRRKGNHDIPHLFKQPRITMVQTILRSWDEGLPPPPHVASRPSADANVVTPEIRYFPSGSEFNRDSRAPQFRLWLPC
jgi:hypothetical protein